MKPIEIFGMAVFIRNISRVVIESYISIENALLRSICGVETPARELAVAINIQSSSIGVPNSINKLDDIIGNGILWAVPKSRRTVERRLKRKFGDPYYVSKLLLPKTNIRVCDKCGHYHEEKVLCPNCYAKIKKETEEIQAAIQSELGLNPVEEGVVVLYEGEKEAHPSEYWKGKRIVEMKKQRPPWFCQNLLQRSVESSESPAKSEVKSTDLG